MTKLAPTVRPMLKNVSYKAATTFVNTILDPIGKSFRIDKNNEEHDSYTVYSTFKDEGEYIDVITKLAGNYYMSMLERNDQ